MIVKIGHAYADENGKSKNGSAGDQTGNELRIQNWYKRSGGWSMVFRAKDTVVAEKLAKTMELACNNSNIGYDQAQRTTLFDLAQKVDWDISKIRSACECDCSSLVAVCVNAAGIQVRKSMYTGNEQSTLVATGKFEVLSDKKYLTQSDYLRRGDILLGPGHTAIVLTDGNCLEQPNDDKIDSAKNYLQSLAGSYTVTATKLNVRKGAGILKKVLMTIPKGTTVKCYGYYTKSAGVPWLLVQFYRDGIKYIGFVSSKYLTK